MALAIALSGGVIMLIAVTMFGMVVPTFMNANERANATARERAAIDDTILKTSIDIASLQANATDGTVYVNVENRGLTKLFDYPSFTVICSYDASSNNATASVTESLAYGGITAQEPSPGTWTLYSFENDLVDPQILNPGESVTMELGLSQQIDQGILTVTISTDNGVTAGRSSGV